MRKLLLLSFLSFLSFISLAQNASTYFPSNPGYTWNFKVIPLDSVNHEINTLIYYRIDSFAVAQEYDGMLANIIVSKEKLSPNLPFTPFLDSSFIAFGNSDAFTYYKLFNIDSLVNSLGSSKILSKIKNVNEASGWLAFYKFAQAENQSYQIYLLDTSVTYNGKELPVRFEINGMRTADQELQTEKGNFTCRKFVIDNIVSYLLAPNFPVPLFTISDTLWIAPDQWIIQDVMPSTTTDLSSIGIGKLYIPGSKRILISQIPTSVDNVVANVNEFKLYQNYPNPFNPSTIISYSLPENSNVQLTIYNILGNKVTTLINKEQNAGKHEVEFNPSLVKGGMSSGIYFYTLRTGGSLLTKKLVYLK